jgi:hypothetical protein
VQGGKINQYAEKLFSNFNGAASRNANFYAVSDTNDHIHDPAGARRINILTVFLL